MWWERASVKSIHACGVSGWFCCRRYLHVLDNERMSPGNNHNDSCARMSCGNPIIWLGANIFRSYEEMSNELIETCQSALDYIGELQRQKSELHQRLRTIKGEISKTKVVSTGLSSTDKEEYADRLLGMAKAFSYLMRPNVEKTKEDVLNATSDYKECLRYVRSKALANMDPLMTAMDKKFSNSK